MVSVSLMAFFGVNKPYVYMFAFFVIAFTQVKLEVYYIWHVYLIVCIWSLFLYLIRDSTGIFFSRYISQLAKLSTVFMEVFVGIFLARRLSVEYMKSAVLKTFIFILLMGIYQYVAIKFGLPHWGLYIWKNVVEVDLNFGSRINSLMGEPKYFAILCSVLSCYYLHRLFCSFNVRNILLFSASVWCLYNTGSALGITSAFIPTLYVIYRRYVDFPITYKLILSILISFSFVFLLLYYERLEFSFTLRESHYKLLDDFSFASEFIYYLDDLIKIPLLTWIDYPYLVIFGFGYGLLHIFSIDNLNYASWFSIEYGYIDSNLGFVSMISNFGLILFLLYSIYIPKWVKKSSVDSSERLFFLLTIFIPVFFGAVDLMPSFLLIGFVLGKALGKHKQNEKKLTSINKLEHR